MLYFDNKLTAYADGDADRGLIENTAKLLEINVIFERPDAKDGQPVLHLDAEGLALSCGELAMRGDFSRMLPRLKAGNLRRELLVRAAKISGIDGATRAVDATAGMGEDSLLLAAAGFSVTLYERDPVIAVLLRDTLRRANAVPELAEIVGRMQLVEGDSIKAMPCLNPSPDVIYLDPMFPERRKSGLVKKKFQILHHLEHPCDEENELLQAAILANPRKVIIKRPAKEPCLAGISPGYSIGGKDIRFDCILIRK